jgi:hypothetical protein
VDRILDRVQKRIGLDVLRRVVLATPVDTGRARGNWQVSIDSFPDDEFDQMDKSGGGTITAGFAVMQNPKIYRQTVISNNVPYIGRLNDGYSKQAPAGFVEAAIDQATRL